MGIITTQLVRDRGVKIQIIILVVFITFVTLMAPGVKLVLIYVRRVLASIRVEGIDGWDIGIDFALRLSLGLIGSFQFIL